MAIPALETLTLTLTLNPIPKPRTFHPRTSFAKPKPSFSRRRLSVAALSKPPLGSSTSNQHASEGSGGLDLGWLPAFPHVATASMANFLFGYHIGVMNGPIEAIARELGFDGDPFLEGLVVSIFIVGAFIGSMTCGSLINRLGCRRTLQIDMVPLIVGAFLSAQAHSLDEILLGRFLVGLGIGVNTVLVPIYISEIS